MVHFIYNNLVGPDGYKAIHVYPYCDSTGKLKIVAYQQKIMCKNQDN